MIASNLNYSPQFFIDYAKKWGANDGATVSADSFMYFNDIIDSTASNSVLDLLQYNTLQPYSAQTFFNKCMFFGSWTFTIICHTFAVAGGLAIYGYNSYALNLDSQACPAASQQFTAVDPVVDGVNAFPASRLFQYTDVGFGNYFLGYGSGAGNDYQLYIQFDGVRISW